MVHFSRYFLILALSVFVCFFSACSNKPVVKTDTFGELDTTRIASDTAMEVNMDRSYEYVKTLVQNDSTVYDFLAYDKPKDQAGTEWESKFIVIKRTNSRQDTVIRANRMGAVRGLSLADLNGDGRPEILFYEEQTADKNRWKVHIYSPKADRGYSAIEWRQLDAQSPLEHYKGGDTFFVYQDHLIRRFPFYEKYEDVRPKGSQWQSYKLSNGKLVLENEKLAD